MAVQPIKPIGPTIKRGWVLRINGKVVEDVTSLELENPRFGKLSYGEHPKGPFDTWSFREIGGGGNVCVPYAPLTDADGKKHTLVGLIPEDRPNMGGVVWCAIGGFVESPTEDRNQGVRVEAAEEAGLGLYPTFPLPGLATNPNRAFFEADAAAGEGVHAFRMPIPFELLEPAEEGMWRFKDPTKVKSLTKGAEKVRFFRLTDGILKCADALARSAVSQLMVWGQ